MAAVKPDKAEAILGNVAPDKSFVTSDGLSLLNLNQLAHALKSMSATTFDHHVTADRNDFCNWIEYVVGDSRLAKQLKDATHAKQAAKMVAARIAELKAPQPKKAVVKKAAPKAAVKAAKKTIPKKAAQKKVVAVKPVSVMLPKKPKAKTTIRRKVDMSKLKKVKQLTKKEVDNIEQHSYLKVKFPHRKMFEQSIIQKHEHINYKLKEFLYGFIVGFVVALILLRMLSII